MTADLLFKEHSHAWPIKHVGRKVDLHPPNRRDRTIRRQQLIKYQERLLSLVSSYETL